MRSVALVVALILPAPRWAAAVSAPAVPVPKADVRRALSAHLKVFAARPPAEGLAFLSRLASLPVGELPQLAADRAAAEAALSVLAAGDADRLRDDRETRILYTRALGRDNVSALLLEASLLRAKAVVDPSLAAALDRAAESSPGLDGAYARLGAAFDGGVIPGFEQFRVRAPAGPSGLLLPRRRAGLERAPAAVPAGLQVPAPEGEGFLIESDGRRTKFYPADNLSLERRSIPSYLAPHYEEMPGGALRAKAPDPLAAALAAAGVELWTLRHGQSETNRAGLLAGGGTDAELTRTPDAEGVSGRAQAAAAAAALYRAFGADDWSLRVLGGLEPRAIVLASPLKRARRTAAAFLALLDERARALAGPASAGRLYQASVERNLREMSFGALEGRPLADVRGLRFWRDFDASGGAGRLFLDRFPGGDSRLDMMIRQHRLLRRVLRDYPGRKVVTVAHFETVSSQKAVLGLLPSSPDGALKASSPPNARPERLVPGR